MTTFRKRLSLFICSIMFRNFVWLKVLKRMPKTEHLEIFASVLFATMLFEELSKECFVRSHYVEFLWLRCSSLQSEPHNA